MHGEKLLFRRNINFKPPHTRTRQKDDRMKVSARMDKEIMSSLRILIFALVRRIVCVCFFQIWLFQLNARDMFPYHGKKSEMRIRHVMASDGFTCRL